MLELRLLFRCRSNYDIMRTTIFLGKTLCQYLQKRRLATMGELKKALGTAVDGTVFRKLKTLGYHTSYSHRGRYYVLAEAARFDRRGLWSYHGVRFSRFGTLQETARQFIAQATRGYTARALRDELLLEVKAALLKLVRRQQIDREKIAGRYVYVSPEPQRRREQLLACQEQAPVQWQELAKGEDGILAHELKAAIVLFVSLLDEQQRRLWAGLESLRLGYGGDQTIASLLGIDPHTVACGRRQLLQRDVKLQRIRDVGAGRPYIKKNPANHRQHPRLDGVGNRR